MSWLKALYAEQTTPNDIVIFLFLGTIVTLLIAVIAYSIVLVAVWWWRYRDEYALSVLLLPPLRQFRANLGEYVLGIFTALLLTFTVSAKQDAINQILESDFSGVDPAILRAAFPVHALKTGQGNSGIEEIISLTAGEFTGTATVKAKELLQPLLTYNLPESANLITRAIVKNLDPSDLTETDRLRIIGFAVALLLGYVGWFGGRRWNRIDNNEKTIKYADVIKRMSAPAICIPLVLISATELGNEDHLVDSAMSRLAATDAPDTPLASAIEVLARDVTRAKIYVSKDGSRNDKEIVDALLVRLSGHDALLRQNKTAIGKLDTRVGDLESRMDSIDGKWTGFDGRLVKVEGLESDFLELRADLEALRSRHKNDFEIARQGIDRAAGYARSVDGKVGPLQGRVKILENASQKGLLLVFDPAGRSAYEVRNGRGRIMSKATGRGLGIHLLPPDRYTISSGDNESSAVVSTDVPGVAIIPKGLYEFTGRD